MITLEIIVNAAYAAYFLIAMRVASGLIKNETLRQVWSRPYNLSYMEFCIWSALFWPVSWIIIYLWWRKQ